MNSTNKWFLTDEEKDKFIATLTPNLTILRTSAEISQEELANLIGVSRQTYSAIERKVRKMAWSTYLSLVLFYDHNRKTHKLIRQLSIFPKELVIRFNDGVDYSDFEISSFLGNKSEEIIEHLDDQAKGAIRAMVEKTIQDERKQAADTIAAIMKDIQDKKMYAAQTKIDQAKANGFSIDPSVASKVTAVLKEVESQLAIMRNASGDEAFTIAMKLTELIADSDELNQSLKKFPPDEVPAVSSKRVGDEITLTWKPSPSIGEITYVVVRKENTYPNGPTDGSTVYNGKELAYTDSNAPKNTVLYYSVFAVRIGVHSKATRLDEAVAIVGKVTNLKAIGGNEMVTLSWTKASTVTEIRLYKYCGYERPQDDSQYETIPCTRLDGLLVNGLTNGMNYWFAISAGHTLNGKTYFSEKAYLSAVPQKPAKPLQDFSVQLIDEVFQAKWTQSEWDVILFYAKLKPEYAVGTIYDLNELLSKYEKIDINLKSLTEAEFRLNFVGECYIVPGVINASNVILNVASYISSVAHRPNLYYDKQNQERLS